jgi:hypothetical protein
MGTTGASGLAVPACKEGGEGGVPKKERRYNGAFQRLIMIIIVIIVIKSCAALTTAQ